MPFKNLHSFRIKSPNSFSGALATKTIAPSISILHGKLKNGKTKGRVVQSYRFNKAKYTFAEAKKWIKGRKIKYIHAEKATYNTVNEIITLVELAGRLSERLNTG